MFNLIASKHKLDPRVSWQRAFLFLVVVAGLVFPARSGLAQDSGQARPVYIVQAGDTLWDIAVRFGVSVEELIAANDLTSADSLSAGAELVIPGLEGVEGVLTTETVGPGEDLRSLSRRFGVARDVLVRLNHLSGPAELYAGATLIIPQQEGGPVLSQRAALAQGQSLLELAVLRGVSPWEVQQSNDLPGSWAALPGDVFHLPAGAATQAEPVGPGALPDAITAIELKPLVMLQGGTSVIAVTAETGVELHGNLAGHALSFFPDPDQPERLLALQGMHALIEPGLYSMELSGKLADGAEFAFSQPVFVKSGNYPFDEALTVPPETIDPAITKPEDAEWMALAATVTPDKQWQGKFVSPARPEFAKCFPSRFGNRRSYNGSPYNFFHTGLDFCGGVGVDVFAPADGTVVFAGPLTVRGNATMIDHGWGVYTAYMHQDEILVQPGDHVKAGQLIGKVGRTGRVTGPHLHFEIFVNGVQVDPLEWLLNQLP